MAKLRVAERVEIGRELLVSFAIGKIAAAIMEVLRKILPRAFINRFGARELIERRAEFRAPLVVCFFTAGKSDHAKRRWQRLLDEQMVKRGNELAGSQI